jgi:NAD(P)H-flavin reductase
VHPGSFVFLRNPSTDQFYDAPLSIMDVDLQENTIKIAIEIKGTKTKKLDELKEDEDVLVKGPFWNGVLGLNIYTKVKMPFSILLEA